MSLTRLDTAKTASNTKKLPKLAAITILQLDIMLPAKRPPNKLDPRITKETPRLAPELMPKTKGPASGFLNNVCIKSPEIPKPEPTRIAVMAFGNLKSIMIVCQILFSVEPNKLEKTDLKGMLTEPKLMFKKKHTNSNTASTVNVL